MIVVPTAQLLQVHDSLRLSQNSMAHIVERTWKRIRTSGMREATERALSKVIQSVFGAMLRRHHETPSVAELFFLGSPTTNSADVVLFELEANLTEERIDELKQEFDELLGALDVRKSNTRLVYPGAFRMETNSAFILYSMVRELQPTLLVETGVANGESTYFLLAALRANGYGTLHSLDIRNDVGCLLQEEETEKWQLHICNGTKKDFKNTIRKLAPICMFIHDSDHSYWWQRFELTSALEHLRPGGHILSDDCDKSYGFIDFCHTNNVNPILLHDSRKVFGIARCSSKG